MAEVPGHEAYGFRAESSVLGGRAPKYRRLLSSKVSFGDFGELDVFSAPSAPPALFAVPLGDGVDGILKWTCGPLE